MFLEIFYIFKELIIRLVCYLYFFIINFVFLNFCLILFLDFLELEEKVWLSIWLLFFTIYFFGNYFYLAFYYDIKLWFLKFDIFKMLINRNWIFFYFFVLSQIIFYFLLGLIFFFIIFSIKFYFILLFFILAWFRFDCFYLLLDKRENKFKSEMEKNSFLLILFRIHFNLFFIFFVIFLICSNLEVINFHFLFDLLHLFEFYPLIYDIYNAWNWLRFLLDRFKIFNYFFINILYFLISARIHGFFVSKYITFNWKGKISW